MLPSGALFFFSLVLVSQRAGSRIHGTDLPRNILTPTTPMVLYVCYMYHYIALQFPEIGSWTDWEVSVMKSNNAATRQDVVINSVDHQISSLANSAASTGQLETLLNSELDHDLIAWPRQYLETYLDSDATGRVPLDAEQLQDVLEAAFDRDAALAREYLEELNGERETEEPRGFYAANRKRPHRTARN